MVSTHPYSLSMLPHALLSLLICEAAFVENKNTTILFIHPNNVCNGKIVFFFSSMFVTLDFLERTMDQAHAIL